MFFLRGGVGKIVTINKEIINIIFKDIFWKTFTLKLLQIFYFRKNNKYDLKS